LRIIRVEGLELNDIGTRFIVILIIARVLVFWDIQRDKSG
jgi:hypothetical protein